MLFVPGRSFPGMPQFAAGTRSPCDLLGEAEPPRFAHTPWMLVLRPLLVGSWLHKPGRVRLPSRNRCAHSSGSPDSRVCMHALRAINENKVITVCGGGSCRGSVWPQPEVLPRTARCVQRTSWAPKLCFVTCSKDTGQEHSPHPPF